MTAGNESSSSPGVALAVSDWTVRPTLGELRRGGEVVRVEPRTMAVLLHLAEHAREVCSRESLLRSVWGDAFVTEEVLTHAVWELRRLLGDDARQPSYIQTVPKQGARTYAQAGRAEQARALLAALEDQSKPWRPWVAWGLAEAYATLGEKDAASRWLEVAYQSRNPWLPWIRRSTAYAPLRQDPRFEDLLRRMNLPA